ncbi:MAG: multicopper oxidase domain-containing protein, partial [Gammaproteobacteria bacterium]|nr:multicopper oxidase domain-containing protein [Gammaproteobacteria bacterium]
RHAQAATVNITLRAEGAYKTLIDGSSIFVWQFRDMNGISGPGALTSALLVKEGDTVNVTIENRIDRPVKFDINGVTLSTTLSVNSGSNRIYSFTAPAAGSYMYTDSHNGELGRAMGLAGPMVVMPSSSNNRLYNNGPTFNRQYTLFMSELDDRLNTAIESGSTYNMDDYEPNYYFANGLSYPETTSRSDTLISMNLGENVAIRFINGGAITYPMHFHGYHVNVATRNRKIETRIIEKDTVQVNRNECVDVILPVVQRGAYPLHTHYVPGVTANGSYANGGLIIMSAS